MLEPDGAKYVFPCWDEPNFKVILYIVIEHLGTYHVLSNLQLEGRSPVINMTRETAFLPTPPIYVNQLKIAVLNINKSSLSEHNIWFVQENTIKTQAFTKIITDVIDEFLKQYTMKRLEHSIIVIFSDLPRNVMAWPFVFLRESDLIYKNDTHFPGRVLEIQKTIAYSKAEQYVQNFNNQNNWDHMWFNKALTLYLSYITLDEYFNARMMELFVVQVQLLAMHNDIVVDMPPITDLSHDPIYSILVYKKASVLLRMLEHIVTKEIFQKAIVEYLNRCSNCTPYNFFDIVNTLKETTVAIQKNITEENKSLETQKDERADAFEDARHNMITDIMSIWLSREYYPILKVEQNIDNKTYVTYNELKQRGDTDDTIKWPVPVTYATKKDPQFSQYALIHWLNNNYTEWNSDLVLTLDNEQNWVILNVQYFGYYRVRYNNTNWLKIIYFLKEDNGKTIPSLNRAQLIDDAYHFVMMDMMDYDIFYELINFLKNETDFIVWHSMMNVLHYMSPSFKFPETEDFKNFIMDIMNSVLTQIGYDEEPTDDNMLKSTRLLLLNWMCNHGNDKCRPSARDKLRAYFKDAKESPILPGWKNWVYCAGLMKPNEELRTLAMNEILHETDKNMIHYLTCYDDDDSIKKLLTWVVLKPRDNIFPMATPLNDIQEKYLYRIIVKKHARKSGVLDFILKNIIHLLPGNMTFLEKLGHVIMSVHSKCQLQKIAEYIDYNINLDKWIYEAKRILTRRILQISEEKDMLMRNSPYEAKEPEC
ncbi:Aminopeptidase N [Harpegnathos saltator]|uniref:Aminopeptidase N n=1 Tax=Harpegnathos saltator TaxID=610380 RepID=E2C142_HARSA|nr:Aminopeptidase N [Harpegnathos saltator]